MIEQIEQMAVQAVDDNRAADFDAIENQVRVAAFKIALLRIRGFDPGDAVEAAEWYADDAGRASFYLMRRAQEIAEAAR